MENIINTTTAAEATATVSYVKQDKKNGEQRFTLELAKHFAPEGVGKTMLANVKVGHFTGEEACFLTANAHDCWHFCVEVLRRKVVRTALLTVGTEVYEAARKQAAEALDVVCRMIDPGMVQGELLDLLLATTGVLRDTFDEDDRMNRIGKGYNAFERKLFHDYADLCGTCRKYDAEGWDAIKKVRGKFNKACTTLVTAEKLLNEARSGGDAKAIKDAEEHLQKVTDKRDKLALSLAEARMKYSI